MKKTICSLVFISLYCPLYTCKENAKNLSIFNPDKYTNIEFLSMTLVSSLGTLVGKNLTDDMLPIFSRSKSISDNMRKTRAGIILSTTLVGTYIGYKIGDILGKKIAGIRK